MSPRAACRLETLGFEQVYDYVGGKADWFAHALPREGEATSVALAGDLADPDPPTCDLTTSVAEVAQVLDHTGYGFALVTTQNRVVLGKVRGGALDSADPRATAESVMEPGPSTVRPDTRALELIHRLAQRNLHTAVVTTPEGRLVGVFHAAEAQRRLA